MVQRQSRRHRPVLLRDVAMVHGDSESAAPGVHCSLRWIERSLPLHGLSRRHRGRIPGVLDAMPAFACRIFIRQTATIRAMLRPTCFWRWSGIPSTMSSGRSARRSNISTRSKCPCSRSASGPNRNCTSRETFADISLRAARRSSPSAARRRRFPPSPTSQAWNFTRDICSRSTTSI